MKIFTFGWAIEVIHCYPLIHDDRLHSTMTKPSRYKPFAEAIAFLAGDAYPGSVGDFGQRNRGTPDGGISVTWEN